MNNYYELNDTKILFSFSEDDQKRIKYLRIPPITTLYKKII